MGFWGYFGGRGEDIWWEPPRNATTADLRVFRHFRSRSDAPCSSIFGKAIAICHRRKFGQVWGSTAFLPESRRKTPLQEGTPLDLRLPHGKIGIILRCNPWPVGWSPRKVRLRVLYGENRPKSANWATLKPRSSTTVRPTKKLTDIANSLALGLQRGINSISLQCRPLCLDL